MNDGSHFGIHNLSLIRFFVVLNIIFGDGNIESMDRHIHAFNYVIDFLSCLFYHAIVLLA